MNDALDVAVGVALVALVGWHWAFLPTFASELIPFWDLAPTWTAAVWIATQNRSRSAPNQDPATRSEAGPEAREPGSS